MPEENLIQAVCPSCGAKYSLPKEYVGQEAECTKCQAKFTIQEVVQAEQQADAGMTNTSTTRMPKMSGSVGMVPQVDDEFKLDVIQSVTPTARKVTSDGVAYTTREAVSAQETLPKKKSWWQFWK